MAFGGSFAILLVFSLVASTCSHHHHRPSRTDARESGDGSSDGVVDKERHVPSQELPFSSRRLEKMLEKAILKIITGDLSTSDMLLLKSFNYSLEEVLAIRERELGKKMDVDRGTQERRDRERWETRDSHDVTAAKSARHRNRNDMDHETKRREKDFDFDAYNRQAVADYENLASRLDQQGWTGPSNPDYEENSGSRGGSRERDSDEETSPFEGGAFERPQIIFKVRYDDSEFDSSGSNERRVGPFSRRRHDPTRSDEEVTSTERLGSIGARVRPDPFRDSSPSTRPYDPRPVVLRLGERSENESQETRAETNATVTDEPRPVFTSSDTSSKITEESSGVDVVVARNVTRQEDTSTRIVDGAEDGPGGKLRGGEYEGLEWVEDDVYRVIPEIADSLGHDLRTDADDSDDDNYENPDADYQQNSISRENETDASEFQGDTPDGLRLLVANVNFTSENLSTTSLSAYQQLALAHRRDQGQKAIEDIKSRVLALTGRFNHTVNSNHVQRERLTMFSPTCLIPRNTDPESWNDPFSMNMHFQLNLTSADHVVAAKLRLFKLPQENATLVTAGTIDEDEDDEKKIRISIYYYTKSLRKHRSKKRLMDSVVTPLTPDGGHLALDVRQGLKFWRLNPRTGYGNSSNHGLVIQVEDQDGHPLKPALYIQEPSCSDQGINQKAYHRQPALFLRACTRYVRVVNGEEVTYVNCRSLRRSTEVKLEEVD